MPDDAIILGGFIDSLAEHGYITAFVRNFPHLRCARGSDNLIRYWNFECRRKTVSKAEQQRVEWWHHGYRAALHQWRPADYK